MKVALLIGRCVIFEEARSKLTESRVFEELQKDLATLC